MIAEVLNGQNYQASWFALPTFLTASVLLAMGFMVRGREQSSRVSTLFCMMTATGAIWLYSYSLMYCALSETVAIFWSQVGQVGVNLIPPAVFSFAVSSLQADAKLRRRVWLVRQLAIGFTLTLLLPDGFLAGVRLHGWGYYPVYDWLGTIFVGFFMLVMAVSLNMYWTSYRNALPGPVRSRNQGLFTALSIAAIGSVDYLAALGVPLYPFGYLPVLGSILLANRTIRRYRLVTITPEFAAKEIIDAMDDALLVLDSSGIVRVSNKAALAHVLLAPRCRSTAPMCACWPNCWLPATPQLWQRMLNGSLREYQCALNDGPDHVDDVERLVIHHGRARGRPGRRSVYGARRHAAQVGRAADPTPYRPPSGAVRANPGRLIDPRSRRGAHRPTRSAQPYGARRRHDRGAFSRCRQAVCKNRLARHRRPRLEIPSAEHQTARPIRWCAPRTLLPFRT